MNRLKRVGTLGNYALALLIASGLLLLLLFGLMDQPITAQTSRTPAQAALEVRQTVGETPGICAPTTAIAITAGRTVYYCVSLRNSGTVTLTRHTFTSALGSATFSQTIPPGQPFQVTANILQSLGAPGAILSQVANASLANTVTVTSTTALAEVATGKAAARVVIGSAALKVTKTIGLTDSCATTKGIAVDLNAMVKYCVTMQNSGTLPLINHRLVDPLLKVDVGFTLAVPPGATLVITDGALRKYDPSQRLEYFVANSITNTLTFTSTTAEGVVASSQDRAVAVIGKVSTVLSYTVAAEDQCGSSATLSVVTGRTVYHCLKLTNNGTLPLETHTIAWTQPPATTNLLNNVTITETIQPGQSFVITRSRIPQLAQANVTSTANNDMTVTSRNRQGMAVTARQQAQVTVGTQLLTVNKYATTNSTGCVTTPPLSVISDQPFYYCVVLTNTGQTSLVRHTFSEGAPVNISGAFTYTLAPNQRITLTNDFLVNTLKLPALFGPFRAATNFLGTMTINSFSAANLQVTQTGGFQVNVTPATLTATTAPTPIPTLSPTISPTPTPSPTLPPTPTPSPVVVSFQPTPTQPFSINSVATPTAGVIPGSVPPGTDQFGQPLSPLGAPTVDITSTLFALTLEAAATQTAMAFIPPSVIDTPIPPFIPPPIETPVAPSPLETPSPTGIVTAVITETTTPTTTTILLVLTPLPTPKAVDGYLDIAAQVFQVSTATLGWLWFVVGSIVFFATAGMFAGLSWHRRGRRKADVYDMNTVNEANTPMTEPSLPDRRSNQSLNPQSPNPQPSNPQSPDDDDYWPASLR